MSRYTYVLTHTCILRTYAHDIIKLLCAGVSQADIVSKVGARHAIVDTIKTVLDRAYPALTDCKFITLLVKKVSEWILVWIMLLQSLYRFLSSLLLWIWTCLRTVLI